MRTIISVLFVVVLSTSVSFGQDMSREQSLQKFGQLRMQLAALETDILRLAKADLDAACEQGVRAIRILPREKYDNVLTVRGGGAYYSFARLTHEYGYGSDIELQQGHLSVGFAGADYGFIVDLGEVELNAMVRSLPMVQFLSEYKPPRGETAIRVEAQRANNFEANGTTYKRRVPAIVGHTYALRSINFTSSDVLVAFKVVRQDSDGSLVVFWDLLQNFGSRPIERVAEILQ